MCTYFAQAAMICYVSRKDGMVDYFRQLLKKHTYEDEELRNLIKLAVYINTVARES